MDVELTARVSDQEVRWTEHRWLVRSLAYAQAQEAALERRLQKAMAQLHELVWGSPLAHARWKETRVLPRRAANVVPLRPRLA